LDAKAIEHYLGVNFPSSQTRTFHHQEASSSSIVIGMIDSINNKEIKPQGLIVIYYAGHGGETTPPVVWDTQGGKIRMFVTHDYLDDDMVITDLGIATLLRELASVKGDNIVSMKYIHFCILKLII
jgi:hypothetical protein